MAFGEADILGRGLGDVGQGRRTNKGKMETSAGRVEREGVGVAAPATADNGETGKDGVWEKKKKIPGCQREMTNCCHGNKWKLMPGWKKPFWCAFAQVKHAEITKKK